MAFNRKAAFFSDLYLGIGSFTDKTLFHADQFAFLQLDKVAGKIAPGQACNSLQEKVISAGNRCESGQDG